MDDYYDCRNTYTCTTRCHTMNNSLKRYCIGNDYYANFTTTRKYYTDEFLNTATFSCSANGIGKTTNDAYQDAKRNANALADEELKLLQEELIYSLNNKPKICNKPYNSHSHHYYKERHEFPIMQPMMEPDFIECNVEKNKKKKRLHKGTYLPLYQAQEHDVHHHIHSTNGILSDYSDFA